MLFHAEERGAPWIEFHIGSAAQLPDFRSALAEATGCTFHGSALPRVSGESARIDVTCREGLPVSGGLLFHRTLRPDRLRPALKKAGVRTLTVSVQHPEAPVSEAPGLSRAAAPFGEIEHRASFDLSTPVPDIPLMIGYRWSDLIGWRGVLTPVALGALALLLWLSFAPGRPGWQAEVKFWGATCIAAACVEAASLFGGFGFMLFLVEAPVRLAPWAAFLSQVLLVYLLIAAIAGPWATSGLRGIRCPIAWRRMQKLLWSLAAFLMGQQLMAALFARSWITGLVFLAGASFAFNQSLHPAAWRRSVRLGSGPLFERVAALGRNLDPDEQFVIELDRKAPKPRRPHNAFGACGLVPITEAALRILKRDEADACFAHAIAHAQDFSRRFLRTAIVAILTMFATLVALTGVFISRGEMLRPFAPLAALAPLLLAAWVRFRLPHAEAKADAETVSLLGSAEPYIRAIARLAHERYGELPEAVMNRIRSVAAIGQIAAPRIEELLVDLSPAPEHERYDVATAIRGQQESEGAEV